MTQAEIEQELREKFEENYAMLRLEGGHALTADVKEAAWKQVLWYYRKLRSVAERVSETEVKLTLPEQYTQQNRRFTIEGVVDIVAEQDKVWMYDIKTHDPDFIDANRHFYEKQLNIYAHIWENIHKKKLDETAVISTAFPRTLKNALESGNEDYIAREVEKWNPVIPVGFDHGKVKETIADFAKVVDKIENHSFEAKPLKDLLKTIGKNNVIFATRTCRNCDGRFSCSSYREYALQSGTKTTADFKKYYEEYRDEEDTEAFIIANLEGSGQLTVDSDQ
ncbi:MAG: hypothetical protein FWH41_00175 [Treponema sp.]|nr:hypothetical protein [Treponema sp.]